MNRNVKKLIRMRQYYLEVIGCYQGYPAPTAYQLFVLNAEEKKQMLSKLPRTICISGLKDGILGREG